jgi:hypothetical protein
VHATQLPPLQTWLVPQLVPAAFALPSTQACAPVLHDVTPLRHEGLGLVVHALPAVQATHAPEPLHTWLLPQLVPAPLLPESLHVNAPVLHALRPVRQTPGLVVHAAPAVHEMQLPAPLQTRLLPQLEPAPMLVAESTQV